MHYQTILRRGLAVSACGLLLACPAAGALADGTAIPFQAAEVTSPDNQAFTISWQAPGVTHVTVYAGTDPRHIGHKRQVAEGAGEGQATVPGLPAEARWYFELVPDHGHPLVLADRSLHLTSAANFRDVGGYRTQDGKWVRMGLAYRSNELDYLDAGELATVSKIGLKLVCDLRTNEERERGPDKVPAGVQQISANVLADDADKLHAMMSGKVVKQDNLHVIYRDFVSIPSARSAYHLLFEKFADRSRLPTVFHCSAGKDRTGWADAVLLTILGVPRETIMRDYVLTDQYLQGDALKHLAARFANAPQDKHFAAADPADLDAAFDEVTQRYGTFDKYLHDGLKLDDATLAAIRKNFLQE